MWYVKKGVEETEDIGEQMYLWLTVGHPKSKCVSCTSVRIAQRLIQQIFITPLAALLYL